jgi:RNA polymerase sigma factor (sigma-70 family)
MTSEQKNKKVAQFFEKEENKLINYVKKLFNFRYSSLAPEDIIQEIALNIFDRIDFDNQIENIASYVYRSIRNRIIDIQRKKNYEISYDSFTDDEDEENLFLRSLSEEDTPEEEYIQELYEEEVVFKSIEQLKPEQKNILVATEFEGFSFEELSKEWKVPIGTLLSRKHRAVAQLQKIVRLELEKL